MRLRHIEVFHAIYSTGSVTRAAELLSVSQPSVSKVLGHAEQQLGYPLFERVKGRLIPTPEADHLFQHVSEVNQQVERLRHVAENLRDSDKGRIRIAVTPAMGVDLLPAIVARWRAEHSETYFTIETLHHDQINSALQESRIDLGLAFEPDPPKGIQEQVVGHGQFFVLGPADAGFPGDEAVPLDSLEDQPFIGLDSRGPLGRILSDHLKAVRYQPNMVCEAETYLVAKALVAHGMGVTIVDNVTARSDTHTGVGYWPLADSPTYRISLLWLADTPQSRVTRAFISYLKENVERHLQSPSRDLPPPD